MVKVREGNTEWVTYFPGEAEVRAFHEENRDLNLFEEPAPETMPLEGENGETVLDSGAPAAAVEKPAKKKDDAIHRRARLIELHESATVQKLVGGTRTARGSRSSTSPIATTRSSN